MDTKKAKGKIAGFYKKQKRMPSYSEIMKLIGYRSKNSVYKLVNKLASERFLRKDQKGKLIPLNFNLEGGVPMLGLIEAGFPSPAEEELSDTLSLDDYLIENKESTYMLKVKGDSMMDAGIRDGDMVLADRSAQPKIGDIVIAEIDEEWTMKYYIKKAGKVCLEPANKKYKTIYPENNLQIAAVVKAIIRKY